MADIVKSITSASGVFLLSWVFPSGIAISLIFMLVLGPLRLQPAWLMAMGPAEQALALAVAATALGLILNGLSTSLYRLLEGYAWPARLRMWGIARQRRRKHDLEQQAEATSSPLDKGFIYERLNRFPADSGQTAPTALGNAMRAFETYGVDRYHLDSQSLWMELATVVPDSLRKELASARASVDFFVALVYLSLVVGASIVLGGLAVPNGPDLLLTVLGVVILLASPFWYSSAVASCTYWDATVRALVNVGRQPLAAALDLRLPPTIGKEREMWEIVAAYFLYPFSEQWADRLDEFRAGATRGATTDDGESPAANAEPGTDQE